jgi:hypothetical protein
MRATMNEQMLVYLLMVILTATGAAMILGEENL